MGKLPVLARNQGFPIIRRLSAALFPRIEFEQRAFRTRLARRVSLAYLILVALWIAGSLTASQFLETPLLVFPETALITGAFLAAIGALALWMVQRQKVVLAGYLLAGGVFLTGAAGVLFFPQRVFLFGPNIVLATLLAGAIIGGGAAYFIATLGIIVSAAGWLYLTLIGGAGGAAFNIQTAFLHLSAVALVSLATAALLTSMSDQVAHTIERLHHQAVRLATLASTDPLTELANRRYLIDQMQREFDRSRRYARPFSLLYLDLDGFKSVNDRHGHLFGDDVLRGAAKAMSAVLRSTDLMARIGGDEFAVLMPETGLDEAQSVVHKLRRALHAYSEQLGPEVPALTFCAGLSQLRPTDQSIETMLQRADEAQYLAKETGKDHTRTQREIPES